MSYDISNDRTRTKVSNTLLNYGKRIQYSVFEMDVKKEEAEMLEKEIKDLINIKEDSVRMYRLCRKCKDKVKIFGDGVLTKNEDLFII